MLSQEELEVVVSRLKTYPKGIPSYRWFHSLSPSLLIKEMSPEDIKEYG